MVSVITYDSLWETVKRKGISIYTLIKEYSFSRGHWTSLKHNRNISTVTLNDLCNILDCEVQAILRIFTTKSKQV